MGLDEFDVCVKCEGEDCEVNTKCPDDKVYNFGKCVDSCDSGWSMEVTVKDVKGCVPKAGFFYDMKTKTSGSCSAGCKFCKSEKMCDECNSGFWHVM